MNMMLEKIFHLDGTPSNGFSHSTDLVCPNDEEIFARITLLHLPRVGNYTASVWVERLGSARSALERILSGALHLAHWNQYNLGHLVETAKEQSKRVFYWCRENQVQIIPSESSLFPISLSKMPTRPLLLFARGNLELLKDRQPYLAIFGKKVNTAFGARAIHSIVEFISQYGMGVVSSIDTQSGHQATYSAIRAGKPPVIVSPLGFDQLLKSPTRRVMQYALDHGALILTDQVPGETQRSFYQILSQVRVQIAASRGVMLTESDPTSGTSYAVLLGHQMELPVFATAPTSRWAEQNPELVRLLRNDKSIIPIACRDDAWKITDYFRMNGMTSGPVNLAQRELPEAFIRSVVAWR